jgi:hypothetical protein
LLLTGQVAVQVNTLVQLALAAEWAAAEAVNLLAAALEPAVQKQSLMLKVTLTATILLTLKMQFDSRTELKTHEMNNHGFTTQ